MTLGFSLNCSLAEIINNLSPEFSRKSSNVRFSAFNVCKELIQRISISSEHIESLFVFLLLGLKVRIEASQKTFVSLFCSVVGFISKFNRSDLSRKYLCFDAKT